MAGKFLIDVTDERFKIAVNESVIDFIRRANPFAHTDVGGLLIELGEALPGASEYCPSYPSCAYVVLHNDANRIFGIAYGQRGLALRLAEPSYVAATADGGTAAPNIGPDWLSFAPYDAKGQTGTRARLNRWSARALSDAAAT